MLTKSEVAEQLGVTLSFVNGMVKRGELRAVKLGERTTRIPEGELARLTGGHE